MDVLALSADRYGADFAAWLQDSRTEIDFLNNLAGKKGVVLMYRPGFSAPEGTVRQPEHGRLHGNRPAAV